MNTVETLELLHHAIKKYDIIVTQKKNRLTFFNQDIISPHVILSFCHQGSARVLYDMREVTYGQNELAIIMPNHVMRQLDCTDDFTYTRIIISDEMLAEVRTHVFSHDYHKFHISPICLLTNQQAERLLSITNLLSIIAKHDMSDLQLRRRLLLAQLSVGYEFLNYYRREQDSQMEVSQHAQLYNQFCKLVAEHYRESREVQYYANLLNLTSRHFSKIIRQETKGLSPSHWIEQYVVAQAKYLIDANHAHTFQEIAYTLGFSEPSSFYRYFKRVTGITAKSYRDSILHK